LNFSSTASGDFYVGPYAHDPQQPSITMLAPAARYSDVGDIGPQLRAMTDSLLTAKEVADLLGVATSWVYEQSRRGQIPTVRLGRYRRYRREAIEAWLEDLEQELTRARGWAGNVR